MKIKNIILGAIGVVVFILLTWIIPASRKTAVTVNYAPDAFKKTIDTSINGVVDATKQEGLYWVTINEKKLPFSYDLYKLPKGWQSFYPKYFIQVGDSIFKNSNSDTFYIIREGKRWQYNLPK